MVELGLLGELKVATEGSSASPFIGRRSGNSSQLQPPPLMAATVAGRRLVGVAERSGGTEATARRARRGEQLGWVMGWHKHARTCGDDGVEEMGWHEQRAGSLCSRSPGSPAFGQVVRSCESSACHGHVLLLGAS